MTTDDLASEHLLDARIALDGIVRVDEDGWQARFETSSASIARHYGVSEKELREAWILHNVPGRA